MSSQFENQKQQLISRLNTRAIADIPKKDQEQLVANISKLTRMDSMDIVKYRKLEILEEFQANQSALFLAKVIRKIPVVRRIFREITGLYFRRRYAPYIRVKVED